MAGQTPSERSLSARAAAYARAARYDGREVTAKARAAVWEGYLFDVDPDHQLAEPERIRRAEALRKSKLYLAALKSAKVRRTRVRRSVEDDLDDAA
jgi:hypothetical protein